MITERSRVCSGCRRLIDDPAVAVCPGCARAMVPHHSQWSPTLKWWLVVEFARSVFHSWKGSQETWESLLRDALNGTRGVRDGAARGERARLGITDSTPASTLYPIALERATAWRASGSPIERPPIEVPANQRTA